MHSANKPPALLIIQTQAAQRGESEFMVALRPDDFNPKALKGHKTDHVIVLLDSVRRHSIAKFTSGAEAIKFVQQVRKDRGIERRTKRIQLPFSLPNDTEVNIAKLTCHIRNLQQRIEGNKIHTQNTKVLIAQHTEESNKPDIMPGIKAHYEHSLIPDEKATLRHACKERRSLEKKLARAKAALTKLTPKLNP